MNPGPTDYESDRNPHGTLTIRRFVLGCLTLADPADQGFSPLCATNVPHTNFQSDRSPEAAPLGRVGGIRMAGWSQNRRGEWHLEVDAPSAEDAAVHVRVLHDDGGCYGVMMKMPFGAHPVAVIEGWP